MGSYRGGRAYGQPVKGSVQWGAKAGLLGTRPKSGRNGCLCLDRCWQLVGCGGLYPERGFTHVSKVGEGDSA